MLRKTERYVDIATENEMKKIIAAKHSERAPIEEAIITFYGMAVVSRNRCYIILTNHM